MSLDKRVLRSGKSQVVLKLQILVVCDMFVDTVVSVVVVINVGPNNLSLF